MTITAYNLSHMVFEHNGNKVGWVGPHDVTGVMHTNGYSNPTRGLIWHIKLASGCFIRIRLLDNVHKSRMGVIETATC